MAPPGRQEQIADLTGPPGLAATTVATTLETVSALAADPATDGLWAATAAFEDTGDDDVWYVPEPGATPVRVVADAQTPMGLLWLGGELYVASTTGVDSYRDFDGTAFAEQRTVLELPEGSGMAGGLALGEDRRIRLGISAPCDACDPDEALAAAVISFATDGSDVRVEASGIRAPVGLADLPTTDDLFVTMNQRDDLDDETPGDWLAVVETGDDWGFPDCWGQADAACDGVPTPVAELDEHAAASGLAVVTGELGEAVGTAAIVAEWATGTVVRVALERAGDDAWTGMPEPFLGGLSNPVPVALDRDAATLDVGDWTTGTIYAIEAAA